MTAKLFVATLLLGSTAACAQAATLPHVLKRQTPIATAGAPQVSGSAGSPNATTPSTPSNGTAPVADSGCVIDQSQAPQDLTLCGNATLFNVWRSKSHVVGREGWINDPMAIYETERDGQPVVHIGWQCHPQHIQWGNISMCAATSSDFTTWTDLGTEDEPRTIAPSQIYDIRGVFDGSIIKGGYEGKDAIFYTSTTATGPLGAVVDEIEGVETQSIAYTEDGGASWIKLPFGAGGNPVIYEWPLDNLTGFRDPYVFNSPYFAALLDGAAAGNDSTSANSTASNSTGSNGSNVFASISGGVRGEGSKLFLYRQAEEGNALNWTYVGPLIETGLNESWSDWSGNFGINFETASINRLNAEGDARDSGDDETAVDFTFFGTEGARDVEHQKHWALWAAVNHTAQNGSITSDIRYAGVLDWGLSYAFVNTPIGSNRQVTVGWTYEDIDATLPLATQMGYQGSFTTFRDIYVKRIANVDPATEGLYERGSWGVTNETDGSITVTTLGSKIVPETMQAWQNASNISTSSDLSLNASGYIALDQQPTDRYYVVAGQFDFAANATSAAGFRVLASDEEYTDILYDPSTEELTVNRNMSSLVKSFGSFGELAKLKLWKTADSDVRTLNLTVVVDNSVLEVHANDEAVITTRVYPWLSASTGAGVLAANVTGSAVTVSNLQLWDGLVNAWPERAQNTSRGLVWDGPIASIYGLWAGN